MPQGPCDNDQKSRSTCTNLEGPLGTPSEASSSRPIRKCYEMRGFHQNLETLAKRVEHHCKDSHPQHQLEPYQSPLKVLIRRTATRQISVADEVFSFIRDRYGHEDQRSDAQDFLSAVPNSSGSKLPIDVFESSEAEMWVLNGRKLLPGELELSICILGFTLTHASVGHRVPRSVSGG